MVNIPNLPHFKFWCQKVLPLVYDDSLSYYEVLCKVVKYINGLIDTDNALIENVEALKSEVNEIQKILNNFNREVVEKIVKDYLATMIFVEISDAGYIVYYIPEEWHDIIFNTTGLDIEVSGVDDYGRLVLSY